MIHYKATRYTPLSNAEKSALEDIIKKYNLKDLDIHEPTLEKNLIINGKIDINKNHNWLKFLNEMRRNFNCIWEAFFSDGAELVWNPDVQEWRYPTDYEIFQQQKKKANPQKFFMEELIKKYSAEKLTIDGITTHIVPKEYYSRLYSDVKSSHIILKGYYSSIIRYYYNINIDNLYISIIENYNSYYFNLLYKYGDKYYHVNIKNGWVCLNCQHMNKFTGLMPSHEDDSLFLPYGTKPEIPDIFRKIPCQKCGRLLSRNFLIIKSPD